MGKEVRYAKKTSGKKKKSLTRHRHFKDGYPLMVLQFSKPQTQERGRPYDL
jgi:hypothetical protein